MYTQALSAGAHHNAFEIAHAPRSGTKKYWKCGVFFSRPAHPSHVGGQGKGRRAAETFYCFYGACAKNLGQQGPPTQLTWEPICWAGGCRVACCHLGDSRMVLVCWQSTFACAVSVLRVRVPAPVNLLGPAECKWAPASLCFAVAAASCKVRKFEEQKSIPSKKLFSSAPLSAGVDGKRPISLR